MNKRKCYIDEFIRSKDDQIILDGLEKYGADISNLIAQTPGPDLSLLLAIMIEYQRVIEQTVPDTKQLAKKLNSLTDTTAYVVQAKRKGYTK